jgi:hypothetical protein
VRVAGHAFNLRSSMAQMTILNGRLEACADCRIGIQIGPKSCKPFEGTPLKSAVVPILHETGGQYDETD